MRTQSFIVFFCAVINCNSQLLGRRRKAVSQRVKMCVEFLLVMVCQSVLNCTLAEG